MGVNPKEKAALAAAWKKSKPAAQGRLSTAEWPDGEYQFEVTTWEPDFAKARIKVGYTIIGGNEAFIGQEHLQHENLTGSEQSMDYFKGRLVNMGIAEADFEDMDPEDVLGDALKQLVMGRKFVGQAKNKNDYLNVYANRPIEGDDSNESQATTDAEESTEESTSGELVEGSAVTFTSKVDGDLSGEVVSVEEGMARVKAENGKVYKLPIDRLTIVTAEESSEEAEEAPAKEETEAEEPAPTKSKAKLPAPKIIQAMKAPELKQLYAKLGIKYEAVKQPRELAVGIAGFVHDKKYIPAIAQLPALCSGLGVKAEKGAKPAVVVSALRQKALAKFS